MYSKTEGSRGGRVCLSKEGRARLGDSEGGGQLSFEIARKKEKQANRLGKGKGLQKRRKYKICANSGRNTRVGTGGGGCNRFSGRCSPGVFTGLRSVDDRPK